MNPKSTKVLFCKVFGEVNEKTTERWKRMENSLIHKKLPRPKMKNLERHRSKSKINLTHLSVEVDVELIVIQLV